MSVLKKFKEYISKPDIKLLSQINVSEEEYELLLDRDLIYMYRNVC